MTAGLLAFAVRALAIRGAAILGTGTGVRWNFLEVGICETASAVIQSLLSGGDGGDTSATAAVVALWPRRKWTHGQKGLERTFLLSLAFDKLSGIYASLTDRCGLTFSEVTISAGTREGDSSKVFLCFGLWRSLSLCFCDETTTTKKKP